MGTNPDRYNQQQHLDAYLDKLKQKLKSNAKSLSRHAKFSSRKY